MTLTLTKTVVEPKWTITEIQETVAKKFGFQMITAMNFISKFGPEAVTEWETIMRANKVEALRHAGVKTPIELVKALAEFEVNMFGSKIEIWGDDKQAFMQYNTCAMWNAMKTAGKFTPKQEEEMGAKYEACMQHLAKDFGFKGETKFEGEVCVLSFSK